MILFHDKPDDLESLFLDAETADFYRLFDIVRLFDLSAYVPLYRKILR